jgi:hypothetical protein
MISSLIHRTSYSASPLYVPPDRTDMREVVTAFMEPAAALRFSFITRIFKAMGAFNPHYFFNQVGFVWERGVEVVRARLGHTLFDNLVAICYLPVSLLVTFQSVINYMILGLRYIVAHFLNPELISVILNKLGIILFIPLFLSANCIMVSIEVLLESIRFIKSLRLNVGLQARTTRRLVDKMSFTIAAGTAENEAKIKRVLRLIDRNKKELELYGGKDFVKRTISALEEALKEPSCLFLVRRAQSSLISLQAIIVARRLSTFYHTHFTLSAEQRRKIAAKHPKATEEELQEKYKEAHYQDLHSLKTSIGKSAVGLFFEKFQASKSRILTDPAAYSKEASSLSFRKAALAEGREILQSLERQTIKTAGVYALGLFGLLITILILALDLAFPYWPFWAFLPLMVPDFFIGYLRSNAEEAFIEELDWRVNPRAFIPWFLRGKDTPLEMVRV